MNLLSFGEEAEAEEQAVETVKGKIKSSHDVLQDPRLLKNPVDSAEMVRILVHPCFKYNVKVRSLISTDRPALWFPHSCISAAFC